MKVGYPKLWDVAKRVIKREVYSLKCLNQIRFYTLRSWKKNVKLSLKQLEENTNGERGNQ